MEAIEDDSRVIWLVVRSILIKGICVRDEWVSLNGGWTSDKSQAKRFPSFHEANLKKAALAFTSNHPDRTEPLVWSNLQQLKQWDAGHAKT